VPETAALSHARVLRVANARVDGSLGYEANQQNLQRLIHDSLDELRAAVAAQATTSR
jgi:hypothetical protein